MTGPNRQTPRNIKTPNLNHLRLHIVLSTRHRFLFIHVPKTGGNSIQSVLLPYSDDQIALLAPHHDGIERFEIRSSTLSIHKHSTLLEYENQLEPSEFSSLIKVCGARNPWDRCVSHFFSPHRGPISWNPSDFTTFIESAVLPLSHYIKTRPGGDNAFENIDYFIRFEHIKEDFQGFCASTGLYRLDLPHLNRSSRRDYRSYYQSEEAVRLVQKKFQDEIEYFGYKF